MIYVLARHVRGRRGRVDTDAARAGGGPAQRRGLTREWACNIAVLE